MAAAILLFACAASTRAMSVIAPTFDQLVASSTLVVRGVVTDIHCITVDTPQGQAIRTLVTLHVERTLKGDAGGADVTLSFLGGKVGHRTLSVIGMPTFNVGDREIVFVANNGQVICPLIAAGHGRYHVRHDAATNRDYVTRSNDAPLTSTEDIVKPLDATSAAAPADGLAPEDFESRVIAAVKGNQQPTQP